MEADAFKANNCGAQWVAEDSSEQAACPGTTDENMGLSPSLSPGWASNTADVLTEQFTSLWTSPNSSTLARGGLSVNLDHAKDFQDIPFNYLARSLSSPHVPPATEAEMLSSPGTLKPSSCAAFGSPPLFTEEALFSQTMKQSPGEQEQLMRQQLEHLQRIVAEQQKIITFYNPGVPAALFPSHFPLGNYFQIQNQECPQINPLIIKPALQPCCTTRASAEKSSKEASAEHPEETGANMEAITQNHESTTEKSSRQNPEGENNSGTKESWLETLSTITEEQGEKQILENSSPSPFGIRTDTRNRKGDDRSIQPGIGVRQRTFEEFVEEQPKIDSQRTEKLQQTYCETKVTPQKSFLKCGEGIARFEKIKVKSHKGLAGHQRRASFGCRNNYSWLAEENTGELLGKGQQMKRQVSSCSGMLLDDKSTHCTISKDDTKSQYHHHHHHGKEEGKKDSNNTYDTEGVTATSEKGSDLLNWSNCSQEHKGALGNNQQRSGIKVQVTRKKKASYPGCHFNQKVLQDRPMDSKVPLQFMMDSENTVSQQMPGRPMDASTDASELYHTETCQTNQEEENSIFQVFHGVSKARQYKNEYHDAGSKSPEIQTAISPGFKKVNDQIVKITPNPDRKQENTTANLQEEHHSHVVNANRWGTKALQCDSDCISTESEDEPKSHCSQYASRHSTHTAAVTSKSTGLSDADYATDEPSEAEDHSRKSCRPLLTQGCSGQVPTGKQEAALVTSSSSSSSGGDSGHRDNSLNCGKMSSHFRNPFCSSQIAAGGRDLEVQRNCMATSESKEFSLKPSFLASHLVASLFPVFKSKADPEDKRATEECDQNRQMGKLKECEGEVLLHPKETSLLAQMKEEQAKAMAILRSQINQLEAQSPGKTYALEECNRDKAVKMQGKKGDFEKHTIKVKEEREVSEIQQQIAGLQEEFRRNETQWHAAHDELKSQLEALTKQNLELQDELRISEHQKMEAERKHRRVACLGRRAETPVSAAILSGTSSQETLEERVLQGSHRSPSAEHVGRKTPQDVFAPRDRKTQATGSAQQSSEILKSITGEQRVRSPPKALHNRSVTPTGRRTPHQMPFEIEKGLPQLDPIQQQSYGKNRSSSASVLNILKDTSHSSYMKGKIFANRAYSSTSGSSEEAAFLSSQNNDHLRSTTLDNVEKGKEDLQRCKKPSEEVAVMADSSGRNSTLSNGRKTPSENVPASLNATRKVWSLNGLVCLMPSYAIINLCITDISSAQPLPSPRIKHHFSYVGFCFSFEIYTVKKKITTYGEQRRWEVKEKIEYPDGKVKQLLMDGRRITTYPNGTKLEISADKRTTLVNFYNGDIKKILPDQTMIYYYADAQATRIVFPNGMEVMEFPNKQIEKYYPDGTEEIVFPDQTVKLRYEGGFEETVFQMAPL
ncbi:hypothetical protein JRQ81_009643 [Phrynocephalus forsythii]|uniref:Centromere protein J n=1 Tax=Phrynocephalus forsythii TaxID=171643 RepID=A0A9Q0Y560_9SAUR|nr:hypothetical protein JRQ81_009643 [Phrynocephalus forsythii]